MRANRWAKQGVLDRVFLALQENNVINIQVDHISLDSTAVKVHPDGTGALKKRSSIYRQITSRLDHQDSYGCSPPQSRRSISLSSEQAGDAPEGRNLLKSLENCAWFGVVLYRTKRSKGCPSREGMLHMLFKLGMCAEEKWRKLRGFDYLAKVITGVKIKDGEEVTTAGQSAA